MKKILFILTIFISFVAAAQPGPVNKFNTRVRYWMNMPDSLQGLPKDTFNLRTAWAIGNGWNNYPWIAPHGDSLYQWSIRQQKWILKESKLASTITVISDSSIQICNSNGVCDTFIVNISAPVVTNVSVINDSTLLICTGNNNCDTVITHITVNPPITNVSVLNDSTIIVCNTNGCDTLVIHTVINPPITTTTILNDSTIIVCNANGCDTIVVNTPPPIISTTVLNDTTIIVCNNSSCDTIIINPPINTTTILNDSTIIVCSNTGCDTLVIHPPITNTTILNDSTIVICGTNSCDTVVFHSTITNITILNDTTVQVCGSNIPGPELVVNGDFNGNANGWQLGALWSYGSNNIIHSFGSAQPTAQAGALVEGGNYIVSANIGGTIGTVDIKLDAGTTHTYAGGAGPVTFTGTWNNANNYKIVLTPSTNFDGFVTNVSIRQILPNCDTLQIPPTLFVPADTFYVENTLYSTGVGVTNHDTIYSSRAGRFDSGHLSMEDWRYHNHKADSLYYHPSVTGVDSFLYDNDLQTGVFWYANDVNPNGLISGGQVVPSGTPYVFNITPAIYRINGVRYTSPGTQITINTTNPAFPRTDVFYVDTSGNAGYLPGIAANPNLEPSVNVAWQLKLTSVDLPAANPPVITDSVIWNENVLPEWIPVTSSGTTSNANNTTNVWLGSKSVDITNINANDVIAFTRSIPLNISSFSQGSLNGFIKLKAVMPSAAKLSFRFFNGATPVSNSVVAGITKSLISGYQPFSINMSSFALTSNIVTQLQVSYTSNDATNFAGFYLDYIYLQTGIANTVPLNNALINVFRKKATDSVFGTYQNGAVSYQFKDSSGAGLTRFGIEDNLGIQDRYVNFQAYWGMTLDSMGFFNFKTYDTSSNNTSVNTYQDGGQFLVQAINNSTGNQASIRATSSPGAVGASLFASDATKGPYLLVSPDEVAIAETAGSINSYPAIFHLIFNNTGTRFVPRFIIDSISEHQVSSPTSIAVWDADTLKSASVASVFAANRQTLQQTFNTEVGGSVITKLDTVLSGAFTVKFITSTGGNYPLYGQATTGYGFYGHATSNGLGVFGLADGNGGAGVQGESDGAASVGVWGISASGQAVLGVAVGGIGGVFRVGPSSTNTVVTIAELDRFSTGTPAANMGGSLDYKLLTSNGSTSAISNQIISKWTTPTTGAATSQLSITGANSSVTNTLLTMEGTGRSTFLSQDASYTLKSSTSTNIAIAAASLGSGQGVNSTSLEGIPIVSINDPVTANAISTNLWLQKQTQGTASSGIGEKILFTIQNGSGGSVSANEIISQLTTVTAGSETSKFIITGINSGAVGNRLVINGDGTMQFPAYGAGTATFDASGNITSVSDVRLKDIQGYYNGGLNELMNVNPIIYKWNEKSGMEMQHNYIGFSAQNIRSSLGMDAIGINQQGYLSIQDRAILATLVNAIKEQQKEIEELKMKINER